MRELLLPRFRPAFIASLVFISYIFCITIYAQEYADLNEAHEGLISIQDDYENNLSNAIQLADNALEIKDFTKDDKSFFEISNLNLWLTWAFIFAIFLFLLAVKKNLAEDFESFTTIKRKRLKKLLHNSEANKVGAETDQQIRPEQIPLVKPSKTVKIKVRKIRRSKT